MTSDRFHKPDSWRFAHFQNKAGYMIRYGFSVAPAPVRGTVVITGGYGRSIEYYYEKINNWLARGFTVYAMDWEGQGGSGRADPRHPRRPPIKDFRHHADTIQEFMTRIVKPAPERPVFLSSHSKGGNIALVYLRRHRDASLFTAAILGAPMFDINTYMLSRCFFFSLVLTADRLGLRHTPLPSTTKWLQDVRDRVFDPLSEEQDRLRRKVHQKYKKQNHDLEIGYPTIGWLKKALLYCRLVKKKNFLDGITTPVLVLSAEKDGLVCLKAQSHVAAALPRARHAVIPGARHGLWYDRDSVQQRLWLEIDRFIATLEPAVPPAPSCYFIHSENMLKNHAAEDI